jgi:phenylpropionate dioxygenase-like ring-hydroxylating dioxygenase large terminal subunit
VAGVDPHSSVPFEVRDLSRIPKERYYDTEFFELERQRLWSRVWQMAARLEEIPRVGDAVEYRNLDESVIVVRSAEDRIRAFGNACRHRGVALVEGRAHCPAGFTCPFHGWCYDLEGRNTFISRRSSFEAANLDPADVSLREVRCEVWGGCVWINLDPDAPPLRECIDPGAAMLEAWQLDKVRAEWWRSIRLPVNWKLAQEAFMEQYHVLETHPQLRIPGRFPPRPGVPFDPGQFIESELRYLHLMSEGMGGMVHATDVAVAERLRAIELPDDPGSARAIWDRALNDAVTQWHRDAGAIVPDLNALAEQHMLEPMIFLFPHFFVLPQYSSASSYRFRPLGPEETLMEIWSLTRYPVGQEPDPPEPPEVWECDDPRIPPIPTQDFSNLPRQQRGLHTSGFEYLRLSAQIEGHLSNFHRTIDAYLRGVPSERLRSALCELNLNPLERPVVDLGLC